jgi:hypothetical protein
MRSLYQGLIPALWLIWLAGWTISGQFVKPVRRAESIVSRLSHLIPLAVAAALLMFRRAGGPWLAARIFTQTSWTFWIGSGLVGPDNAAAIKVDGGCGTMAARKAHADPALPDGLTEVIQALRGIYNGASATGRWCCEEDHEAVSHDRDEPDAGYYDRDHPPAGYDADSWSGTHDRDGEPAEPLKPCGWEDYTLEEQSRWLKTCAATAKRALEQLGVPLIFGADK